MHFRPFTRTERYFFPQHGQRLLQEHSAFLSFPWHSNPQA